MLFTCYRTATGVVFAHATPHCSFDFPLLSHAEPHFAVIRLSLREPPQVNASIAYKVPILADHRIFVSIHSIHPSCAPQLTPNTISCSACSVSPRVLHLRDTPPGMIVTSLHYAVHSKAASHPTTRAHHLHNSHSQSKNAFLNVAGSMNARRTYDWFGLVSPNHANAMPRLKLYAYLITTFFASLYVDHFCSSCRFLRRIPSSTV